MQVRVLLFASYRDAAGADELRLRLPAGATAADAVERLRADVGAAIPAAPAVAVNQAYAPLTVRLADGDELALIPPVSGG